MINANPFAFPFSLGEYFPLSHKPLWILLVLSSPSTAFWLSELCLSFQHPCTFLPDLAGWSFYISPFLHYKFINKIISTMSRHFGLPVKSPKEIPHSTRSHSPTRHSAHAFTENHVQNHWSYIFTMRPHYRRLYKVQTCTRYHRGTLENQRWRHLFGRNCAFSAEKEWSIEHWPNGAKLNY